jgi:effector-binding domain-containing protein
VTTVSLAKAEPRLIAAVRREVRIVEVATAWKPALDLVWAFLRKHQELKPGHNLFLYHHPPMRAGPMQVDFGVEVPREFEPEGEVRAVKTPSGETAHAVHRGPYDEMKATHDAIHEWAAKSGRQIGNASWERYGDWVEDASKLETEIFYLLG